MAKKKASSRLSQRPVALPVPEKALVFVSHATYDKWIARVLCEKIEALGTTTFRDDRDIAGGDSIPDVIKENIWSCSEMIVLLTPKSRSREWVLLEIEMADILGKRIIPVLYHIEPTDIPELLASRRAYFLDELDDYLAELKQRKV